MTRTPLPAIRSSMALKPGRSVTGFRAAHRAIHAVAGHGPLSDLEADSRTCSQA
jgi:hypothetical protein